MSSHIQFISAGAGSGKTYRVTEHLEELLASGKVQPSGVIATTFTRLAATELREGVRQRLMADGKVAQAVQMGQALIGTVNSVCGQLLMRFAFEAGLSPDQRVLEEEQGQRMFGAALEELLGDSPHRIPKLNAMARRLGMTDKKYQPDWRKQVMDMASMARANNMSPDEIRIQAGASTEELLAMFASPYEPDRDLNLELLNAVTHALQKIDTEEDSTKGTATYVTALKNAQANLQQVRMTWAEWVALSKKSPTRKSAHLAEQVQVIAGDYEKHPLLHVDIRGFCEEVFDLAASSIEAFQDMKARQGMVDFVDQEQRVYELLDHPHVKAVLGDELQVLFVDEFQDTSPIQLALFMKLAALADRVVWVGDVKQAIYGFRGSDPELMQAVLRGVAEKGGMTDVLPYSWRSRPSLVDYTNQIFAEAFAETISPEQVKLKAKREEASEGAAVACWHLAGSNVSKRANDIAFGIQNLIDSAYQVVDKTNRSPRPARYGDIAVLCRTKERLIEIASACAKARIPVAFKRPGLITTSEGALALACLRRLADPRDTLATAELRTLVKCQSPQDWLPDRMAFLESDSKPWLWGESDDGALPALEDLAEARKDLSVLTPREALELALIKGKAREAVISWGPTADEIRHRLRNIDLLLEYAAKYEDQCKIASVAATVPGLILWLYELARRGEDRQAEAADGRAVTLATHHGAKGLEWPVVIAVDLDSKILPRLWGLNVLQRDEGFDLDEPLNGRRLRYWPRPFGQQSAGIAVFDRINESGAGIAARASAIEETKRLLYVSCTRARDLLVFALPSKNPTGEWLQTLGADWLVPSGERLELPGGRMIPSDFKELEAPEEWSRAPEDLEAWWVAPGIREDNLLQRDLTPSAASPLPSAIVGDAIDLGDRVVLSGVENVNALGMAIHNLIAAEVNSPDNGSLVRASHILSLWGLEGSVDPKAAVCAAQSFIDWVRETYNPVSWCVEYPITHALESGQVVQGFIDLLLETKDGWVIVDHKATPRPRGEWKEIAGKYSGQLAMYRAAVEASSDQPVIATWLHMPVGGGMIRVTLP